MPGAPGSVTASVVLLDPNEPDHLCSAMREMSPEEASVWKMILLEICFGRRFWQLRSLLGVLVSILLLTKTRSL